MKKIFVNAPGKLMVSGEWSVLERGVPALVVAIDKYVKCEIKESKKNFFSSEAIKVRKLEFSFEKGIVNWQGKISGKESLDLIFAEKAIEIALKYLKESGIERKNFEIVVKSEISHSGKGKRKVKFGFGSSSAVVAVIITAVLKLHGIKTNEKVDEIFKLACVAHYTAQKFIGSGYDVAATVYGGLLVYRRFDGEWLNKILNEEFKLLDLVENEWPSLDIRKLQCPSWFRVCVVHSGKEASTTQLISKMNRFKNADFSNYKNLIEKISQVTGLMIKALEANNKLGFLGLVRENRRLLKELGVESGIELETKELAEICDIASENGCAGKFSGAGGGDSAIVICSDDSAKKNAMKKWKGNNYEAIEIKVSKKGAA